MTVTIPSSFVMFRPVMYNSYKQKSPPPLDGKLGSWHLSYSLYPLAGTTLSICKLALACDLFHGHYYFVSLQEVLSDQSTRRYICRKCLEKVDRDGQ